MKKNVRVAFVCFHENYNVLEDEKYHFLRREYDLVLDEENPEYVLFGAFGYKFLQYKDAIRIFCTGEAAVPDYNLVDYSIDFEHMDYGDRHLRAPLGRMVLDSSSYVAYPAAVPIEQRKFCNFVYSNPIAHPFRDEFFLRLSSYRLVDSGGRHLNNIGAPVVNKMQFLSQYKFTIAFENALHDGYTSEKVIDGLVAHTIPIYWGNPSISRDINAKRIVNCHNYANVDEVITAVKAIDQNAELFESIVQEPWLTESQRNDQHPAKVEQFLKYIFDQPLAKARRRGVGTWNSLYEHRLFSRIETMQSTSGTGGSDLGVLNTLKGRVKSFYKKMSQKHEHHGICGLPVWFIKSLIFRVRNRTRIVTNWWVTRDDYGATSWMADVSGLIHVGANDGRERFDYAYADLNVLWVEPINSVFKQLVENIKNFPRQVAVNALITERDGDEVEFHVANNSGASSSIFEFAEHADIWPGVFFEDSVIMTSQTLDTVLSELATPPRGYQALVMDVQGAELKVLQGAEYALRSIKYIVAEAADFNVYEGGCTLDQLVAFLSPLGFKVKQNVISARHPVQGTCSDVLFVRRKGLTDRLKRALN